MAVFSSSKRVLPTEGKVMLKTTFNISKMDCPSEERMIQMKLERLGAVKSLKFHLPGRKLAVYHTGSVDNLLTALESLQLDTSLVSSEPMDTLDRTDCRHEESRVLWQVLIINFFFFVLEILTGFIAGSMGLVADSLDMLADSIVYGLALFVVGETVSRKKEHYQSGGVFPIGACRFGTS